MTGAFTPPLNHHHGAVGKAGDLVRDAAQKIALDIAEADAADHYQISLSLLVELVDGARRLAILVEGANLLSSQLLCIVLVTLGILASIVPDHVVHILRVIRADLG
jgi:hypothetical protein